MRGLLSRLYKRFQSHRLLAIAAGVTFYALLAIFPAIAALVSVYGLVADAQTVAAQAQSLAGLLPGGAVSIIAGQAQRIAQQGGGTLSFSFLLGLAISLWSANAGMKAVFDALNAVYGLPERRSFIRLNSLSLIFTIGAIALLLLAAAATALVPMALALFNFAGSWIYPLLRLAPWPVLLAAMTVALEMLYRCGPDRDPRPWRFWSAGSLAAATGWVAGSALFSWYVANFGSYNETYGSLGAAIGFMTWMWLSAIIVLLGAAAEAERESAKA